MKIKCIVTSILFILGMLVCLCAVGSLDYMDRVSIKAESCDFARCVIGCAIGLTLMTASFFTGRGIEFPDEK